MLRKTIENERASSADLNSTNLMAPHSTWLSPLDLYFTSSSVLTLVRNKTRDSKPIKVAERRQGGEWGECPNETLTNLNLDSSKIASIQVNFLNRMENFARKSQNWTQNRDQRCNHMFPRRADSWNRLEQQLRFGPSKLVFRLGAWKPKFRPCPFRSQSFCGRSVASTR